MRTLFVLFFTAFAQASETQKSICSRNFTTEDSRELSKRGNERHLVLSCGSAPACAAAALLRVLLVHSLGYRSVALRIGPHQQHVFTAKYPYSPIGDYDEIIVDVSSAWEPFQSYNNKRFTNVGVSNIPARRKVLARLSPAAANTSECDNRRQFDFYANSSALQLCNFTFDSEVAPLYVVNDPLLNDVQENTEVFDNLVAELKQRVAKASLKLEVRIITRQQLLLMDGSLLFVDFNIYTDNFTATVQPPPCYSSSSCSHGIEEVIPLLVNDYVLRYWEPALFKYIKEFSPPIDYLKEVIELTLSIKTKENQKTEGSLVYNGAACKWVDMKAEKFESLRKTIIDDTYRVVVFFCNADCEPEGSSFSELINKTNIYINKSNNYTYEVYTESANCSDEVEMLSKLTRNHLETSFKLRLLGVLIPRGAGVRTLAKTAREYRLPTIAYDVVGASEDPDIWQLTPIHLQARALALFIRASEWNRVAVLSELTTAAEDFVQALKQESHFVIGDFQLTHKTKSDLLKFLMALWNEKRARIFFINADNTKAFEVLRTVPLLDWNTKDYVLITRDRLRNDQIVDVEYYTISPHARRRVNESNVFKGDRLLGDFMGTVGAWPTRHSTAIVDGLWMLVKGFDTVWRRYPASRNDLRNTLAYRELAKILEDEPIPGVTESLQFRNRVLTASWMYVERRHGRKTEMLDTWWVNMKTKETTSLIEQPPHDGRTFCILRRGDPFIPTCLDIEWAVGLFTLLLLPIGGLVALRAFLLRLKRHDDAIRRLFLLSRAQCTGELVNWQISRNDIRIEGFLGAGHFGRVSLGKLKTGAGTWCSVAVKELHEGASLPEESEFLREACTLASLSHEHVVRLVGVCDDGRPPLLLTEVALFGDLLGYLSTRRHLAEDNAVPDEAGHVSAAALTRLAREAAAALQHLAARGVVHRDVRAANCLVDARRTLKLADFGMARRTGAAEYVCMRRAVVPVRWMAPEAVMRGAFSAASDVWALGVLLLEIMTLGARPWGAAPPARVLERVAAGERPPLPRDASPPVRALTALCWADVVNRPAADQVRAYLIRNPEVLRPTFAMSDLNDAESGYGGTPRSSPYNSTSTDCYITVWES